MQEPTILNLHLLIARIRDYAIFTLSPVGIITSWSPGAVAIKGYTAEEAIGQHFSILYRDEDAKRGIPDDNLRIAEAEGIFRDPEGIRKRKNGQIFTAEVEIVSLVENGVLLGFAKVIRDVTERITMRDDLRKANNDLDQFTAVAAHDLQEPLRMVTSYLTLLNQQAGPALDAKLREYLAHAVDGAARMQRLIANLRDLSRIGQGRLNLEVVDLNAALDEALHNLSVRIRKGGATVAQEAMPKALADRLLIIQVFQNLVSNALKFVRAGEKPQVHISAAIDDGARRVLVSVRDNGIGMRPEDRERIFRAFERVTGGYPGSGLGLSICQRVIERHHCHIWVDSELGVGSTFRFTLPVG